MLMMTYDNVYVAQCSMGANPNQLIKAIKEAEAHKARPSSSATRPASTTASRRA